MIRSATSVGAHYREAHRAKSDADFFSKIEGVLQELDESGYWMELLIECKFFDQPILHALFQESDELTCIFVTITRQAKHLQKTMTASSFILHPSSFENPSSLKIPTQTTDPINARILSISEDKIQGFLPDPLGAIADQSGVETEVVIERIQAMLRAGVIRRVRQTLMATNLAPGSLVAWQVPEDKLQSAFDWMFQNDPFSGHVVIRTTDAPITGAKYRLWTTLKVPQGFSMERHCEFLCAQTGATHFKLMPAKRLFALGVGHVRRRLLEPGSKNDEPGVVLDTQIAQLSALEWRVLTALKREFEPEELRRDLWRGRAEEAGVSLEEFLQIGENLNQRRIIGRFSTFLEHTKTLSSGERVTKFNALFHWRVPQGSEIKAGREVGRFHIMTHAYWREGGPEFNDVNIMGVAHGTDKNLVLAHKAAIDAHLESVGIPVDYTNVFWGGRSEIKPSEISPFIYEKWASDNEIPT